MPRITPKKEHSPHKRTKIVTAFNCGLSAAQIAENEGISKAVYGIVHRYKHQESTKSSPRVGRPHKLGERKMRQIFRAIANDPFISNEQLIREADLNITSTTLAKYLREKGIIHFHVIQRPKLTPENAQQRLEFARRYESKPIRYWRNCIFSDETTVERGSGEQHKWVRCCL